MTTLVKLLLSILLTSAIHLFGQQEAVQAPLTVGTFQNILGREIPIDSMDAFLEGQMKTLQVPGLSIAIINQGEVVYHRTMGYADLKQNKPVNKRTIFEGASLSKPLFGYFAVGLVEEGLLDLDTPLYQYLPYADIAYDERYKKITARLQTKKSGLEARLSNLSQAFALKQKVTKADSLKDR